MRRSICITEPNNVLAGNRGLYKFHFTTSTSLHKGAKLRFDLCSNGRGIDWQPPQTDLKKTTNLIWATLPDERPLQAKAIEIADRPIPLYEFTLPTDLKVGQTITFYLGSPSKGDPEKQGNGCQHFIQRRKPFNLYISPKGDNRFEEPEVFTMDIRGNKLENLRIIAPSFVGRGKRFDIVIRFEDHFGNLTHNATEGALFELSYENIRENLNWKLFVPETGFVTLPNLYFNDPGIYKIQLVNTTTKEKYVSSPIKCFNEAPGHLFWGLLHGNSEKVDSTESIEISLRHFRDEKAFNFFSLSPFEEDTTTDMWRFISQHVTEFNENDRFITLLGLQWKSSEGLRQFVFTKDAKSIIRHSEIKTSSLPKIYKSYSPKDFISIPTFTMGGTNLGWNFEHFNSEFERVVEIYNAWGSSECTEAQGNLRPIGGSSKKCVQEFAKGSLQMALNNGYRFGFVAGGLDDRGPYAEFLKTNQNQYTPGLTGIIAAHHNRDSIVEALYNRSCYATTGAHIIVNFEIAGHSMGKELSVNLKPGLAINRFISGGVAGTAKLKKVELIRNGEIIHEWTDIKGTDLEFEYDDADDLAQFALQGELSPAPFAYYYLRVLQEDMHIAWSSPIWIDFPEDLKIVHKKKK